jgi:transaldolase
MQALLDPAARRLQAAVDRPKLMTKVSATKEGRRAMCIDGVGLLER